MNDSTQQNQQQINMAPGRRFNSLYLIIVLVIGLYLINYQSDIDSVACTEEIIATEPDVIMLGTSWCRYCADARRFFDKNQIQYCEYDIERTEHGKQLYSDLNGRGIPIFILNNGYQLVGYDEQQLESALRDR